jgi:hypothetical protein
MMHNRQQHDSLITNLSRGASFSRKINPTTGRPRSYQGLRPRASGVPVDALPEQVMAGQYTHLETYALDQSLGRDSLDSSACVHRMHNFNAV